MKQLQVSTLCSNPPSVFQVERFHSTFICIDFSNSILHSFVLILAIPFSLLQEFLKSSKYPVIIISYEMFLRSFDTLKNVRFDVIVCDEGHRLKNNSTKTTSV